MNKQSEKLKVKGQKYKICATDFEGITLVALVITIIVLIILAGVSINAIMNQGLITNAKEASGKFNKEKDVEQLLLTNLEGIAAVENLKEVKAGGYTGTENCKYIEGGKTAVIPAGFTVSKIEGENTISGGLVIYSGEVAEADWSADTDEIIIAQKNYNQYVWIPVENPSDMYGVLESQVEGIEGIKYGKLYDVNVPLNWPTESEYSATSSREPAVLSKYYEQESTLNFKQEFDDMITSVEKYKGFYIGRYELTSSDGTAATANVVKGANPVNGNWFDCYNACKNSLELENEQSAGKICTSIIWGCQWDQAVKATLDKVPDFLTNAKAYGVYSDSKITELGVTGRMDSAYNIYDMGGNVTEWTLEAKRNAILGDVRVCRGGWYGNESDKRHS